MLYGAIHGATQQRLANDNKVKPKGFIYVKAVSFPLEWILTFLKDNEKGLSRTHLLIDRHAPPSLKIRTDASTTGLGALLLSANETPMGWVADIIRNIDLRVLGATRGDPAFMAEFEMLAVLMAFKVWGRRLQGHRVTCLLQVDSQAAQGAISKLASPSPVCNALAAELSLVLESCNIQLLTDHIRSEANLEADALSRLAEGKKVPQCLRGIKATPPPDRTTLYRVMQQRQERKEDHKAKVRNDLSQTPPRPLRPP
jgi:hypothetical protein